MYCSRQCTGFLDEVILDLGILIRKFILNVTVLFHSWAHAKYLLSHGTVLPRSQDPVPTLDSPLLLILLWGVFKALDSHWWNLKCFITYYKYGLWIKFSLCWCKITLVWWWCLDYLCVLVSPPVWGYRRHWPRSHSWLHFVVLCEVLFLLDLVTFP